MHAILTLGEEEEIKEIIPHPHISEKQSRIIAINYSM
jgi:hypothetical protein